MLTVISETRVKPGREAEWDSAYHERAADARTQAAWVDLHLLVPVDDQRTRVIVGTWRDREGWARWHDTDVFQRTRDRLDAATESGGEHHWYDVVEDRVAAT